MRNRDILQIDKILKNIYEVSNVEVGFRYWFFKLLNITLDLFNYEGSKELQYHHSFGWTQVS
jgi:hypothetical protein